YEEIVFSNNNIYDYSTKDEGLIKFSFSENDNDNIIDVEKGIYIFTDIREILIIKNLKTCNYLYHNFSFSISPTNLLTSNIQKIAVNLTRGFEQLALTRTTHRSPYFYSLINIEPLQVGEYFWNILENKSIWLDDYLFQKELVFSTISTEKEYSFFTEEKIKFVNLSCKLDEISLVYKYNPALVINTPCKDNVNLEKKITCDLYKHNGYGIYFLHMSNQNTGIQVFLSHTIHQSQYDIQYYSFSKKVGVTSDTFYMKSIKKLEIWEESSNITTTYWNEKYYSNQSNKFLVNDKNEIVFNLEAKDGEVYYLTYLKRDKEPFEEGKNVTIEVKMRKWIIDLSLIDGDYTVLGKTDRYYHFGNIQYNVLMNVDIFFKKYQNAINSVNNIKANGDLIENCIIDSFDNRIVRCKIQHTHAQEMHIVVNNDSSQKMILYLIYYRWQGTSCNMIGFTKPIILFFYPITFIHKDKLTLNSKNPESVIKVEEDPIINIAHLFETSGISEDAETLLYWTTSKSIIKLEEIKIEFKKNIRQIISIEGELIAELNDQKFTLKYEKIQDSDWKLPETILMTNIESPDITINYNIKNKCQFDATLLQSNCTIDLTMELAGTYAITYKNDCDQIFYVPILMIIEPKENNSISHLKNVYINLDNFKQEILIIKLRKPFDQNQHYKPKSIKFSDFNSDWYQYDFNWNEDNYDGANQIVNFKFTQEMADQIKIGYYSVQLWFYGDYTSDAKDYVTLYDSKFRTETTITITQHSTLPYLELIFESELFPQRILQVRCENYNDTLQRNIDPDDKKILIVVTKFIDFNLDMDCRVESSIPDESPAFFTIKVEAEPNIKIDHYIYINDGINPPKIIVNDPTNSDITDWKATSYNNKIELIPEGNKLYYIPKNLNEEIKFSFKKYETYH
ncbi:MAG: hypothetical protein ACRC4L_03020, partial [Mycoplasma sp.]